jgi:hypothetical protein
MPFPPRWLAAVTLLVPALPASASAAPVHSTHATHAARTTHSRMHLRSARARHGGLESRVRGCLDAPVEVVAGSESATFSLARCDGTAAPSAVDRLTTLARAVVEPPPPAAMPSGVSRPRAAAWRGTPSIDPGLVERLEKVVDHFRRRGELARVVVVSSYRSAATSHYHARGRALDVRLEGVENPALVEFCKTLPDTGCGSYPNDTFVHFDVRDPGTGSIAWTDLSRAGQAPRFARDADVALPSLPDPSDHAARHARVPAPPVAAPSVEEAPAAPAHAAPPAAVLAVPSGHEGAAPGADESPRDPAVHAL